MSSTMPAADTTAAGGRADPEATFTGPVSGASEPELDLEHGGSAHQRLLPGVLTELRATTWPTRTMVIRYSTTVLIFLTLLVAAVYGVDAGVTSGVLALLG
jgi:preprotein translocase SecE subunit